MKETNVDMDRRRKTQMMQEHQTKHDNKVSGEEFEVH
jgi:hypothetical protein